MTTTPDLTQYPGYGAYNWYAPTASVARQRDDPLSRYLWVAVAILGVATFAASLGSASSGGYPVRLSVLAAAVAAVGLLPGQHIRGWIVVVLSVAAFFDALSSWVYAEPSQWALIVAVLTTVQSLAAVAALLRETQQSRTAESAAATGYSAYAQFAQMYQAYAAHYQQPHPARQDASAPAAAYGQGEGNADAAAVAQQSSSALRAKYAQQQAAASARQSPNRGSATSEEPVGDLGAPGTSYIASEPNPYPTHPHRTGGGNVASTSQ